MFTSNISYWSCNKLIRYKFYNLLTSSPEKMCPWDSNVLTLANRKWKYYRSERGDMVQLTLIMLQTKYQINPTYKSPEIFEKN